MTELFKGIQEFRLLNPDFDGATELKKLLYPDQRSKPTENLWVKDAEDLTEEDIIVFIRGRSDK